MPKPTFAFVLGVLATRREALSEAAGGNRHAADVLKGSSDPVDVKLVEEFRRHAAACDETLSLVEAMEETIDALRISAKEESARSSKSDCDVLRAAMLVEIKRRRAFFEEGLREASNRRAVEDGESVRHQALADAMSGLATFVETL